MVQPAAESISRFIILRSGSGKAKCDVPLIVFVFVLAAWLRGAKKKE
jgi:hypothetical protein